MKIKLTAHWRERVPGEDLEVSDSVGLALIGDGVAVSLDEADDETPTADEVEMPPRTGAGSGAEKWAQYAAAKGVTVADGANRDDIIAALDAAGIRTMPLPDVDDDAGSDNNS